MANISKPLGLGNIWAEGGTKINPGTAKTNIGWVVQLPPYEYQNWIDNKQDRAIAHINQHGIAVWDDQTEYQGQTSYTQASNGVIYKCLQTNTNRDPVSSLNSQFWTVAFEDFGSVAALSLIVDNHINAYQTLSGISNLPAARANLSVYSRLESNSRFAALNGSSAEVFSVAPATAPEHAVRLGQVSGLLTQATESVAGVVRLATNGLTEGGTDDTTAITPLKANNVYLKKSGNLAGLTSTSTARNNLGLGSAATVSVEAFLQPVNNLSDITDSATARNNLGITSTATRAESYFLRSAQNLSDIASPATARTNLGLVSTAITPLPTFVLKADNLAGLASPAQARTNLGLGSAATSNTGDFLNRANNLGDLTNVQQARNNLGLGSAATMSVFGATGLDFTSSLTETGYTVLPNGLIIQWGVVGLNGGPSEQNISFPISYNSMCFNVQVTNYEDNPHENNTVRVRSKGRQGFRLSNGGGNTFTAYMWLAFGV